MAEKRTYTVPLRRKVLPTERHQRTKKAVTILREFMTKHMKAESVKIGPKLNEHLWERGIRKPPGKVAVVCEKNEDGVVFVELEGTPLPSEIASEKKSE